MIIVERPAVRVAYLRYTGPFGDPLARFWRLTFGAWLAEHDLLDCPRYGVALDNPAQVPAEKCRFDCCVELPTALEVPGAELTTVPGGRYAVAPFRGTSAQIASAWSKLHMQVHSHGLTFDMNRLPIEHYPRGATFDPKTQVFACELCAPIL